MLHEIDHVQVYLSVSFVSCFLPWILNKAVEYYYAALLFTM